MNARPGRPRRPVSARRPDHGMSARAALGAFALGSVAQGTPFVVVAVALERHGASSSWLAALADRVGSLRTWCARRSPVSSSGGADPSACSGHARGPRGGARRAGARALRDSAADGAARDDVPARGRRHPGVPGAHAHRARSVVGAMRATGPPPSPAASSRRRSGSARRSAASSSACAGGPARPRRGSGAGSDARRHGPASGACGRAAWWRPAAVRRPVAGQAQPSHGARGRPRRCRCRQRRLWPAVVAVVVTNALAGMLGVLLVRLPAGPRAGRCRTYGTLVFAQGIGALVAALVVLARPALARNARRPRWSPPVSLLAVHRQRRGRGRGRRGLRVLRSRGAGSEVGASMAAQPSTAPLTGGGGHRAPRQRHGPGDGRRRRGRAGPRVGPRLDRCARRRRTRGGVDGGAARTRSPATPRFARPLIAAASAADRGQRRGHGDPAGRRDGRSELGEPGRPPTAAGPPVARAVEPVSL